MKEPHFLWITDPWETLDHPKDTTLRLIEEAAKLKLKQSWCHRGSLFWEQGKVKLETYPIFTISQKRTRDSVRWGKKKVLEIKNFTQIHYRVDPPVNHTYLHPLKLLKLGSHFSPETEFVNPLRSLFEKNEKIEPAHLKNLMPPSIISSQWELLLKFGKKEKKTLLKPLHTSSSQGIEALTWRNARDIKASKNKLTRATDAFESPVLIQRFLPEIYEGEIRLWFLDGKLLGTLKKYPLQNDYRVHIDQGSTLKPYKLSDLEKKTALTLSKYLQKEKIRLAAIDMIGNWVTDFNFTSPGLLVQMELLSQKNLATKIISRLARSSDLCQ